MDPNEERPLVSIVTPVYNGAKYLAPCMESVIAQTYRNWEYILVDNCSTDGTPGIIRGYAQREARIRAYTNAACVDAIDNHNIALRHISPDSAYCKVLQADDWLYPQHLEKMVGLARRNPSVGMIGSYVVWNDRIGSDGLPPTTQVLSGREICRLTLLKRIYPFVNLSSLLFRSDLVRNRDPFLREKSLHTDVETCYELLQGCDFGFVHQVLSFVRRHEASRSTALAEGLDTYRYGTLYMLVKFGPVYLSAEEFRDQFRITLKEYYRFLASALWQKRDAAFWKFHADGLDALGFPIDKTKLRIFWLLAAWERVLDKVRTRIGESLASTR